MKRKVAIYTIESDNLGNKLQNYAVQCVLEKQGCRVKTIRRKHYPLKKWVKDNARVFLKKDRFTNFLLFSRKIHWDYHYIDKKHIPKKINERYELFVIGSDQIWNPTFPFSSDIDYLPFVDGDKCISYAASFGVDRIPAEHKLMVKEGLNHIKHISVREDAGAIIAKKLTGKEAIVLIDPTMMLDATDWLRVAKEPKHVNCNMPYILTYFLGGRTKRVDEEIQQYARKYHLEVYNLMDYSQKNLYATGPSEFIYLISHAKLVMTDSFHACVFSFLFQKPFLVYGREGNEKDMMSRMDTLLGKFDLKRKYVDSGLKNALFECDYGVGHKQLQIERKKTEAFLKKVLDIDE